MPTHLQEVAMSCTDEEIHAAIGGSDPVDAQKTGEPLTRNQVFNSYVTERRTVDDEPDRRAEVQAAYERGFRDGFSAGRQGSPLVFRPPSCGRAKVSDKCQSCGRPVGYEQRSRGIRACARCYRNGPPTA